MTKSEFQDLQARAASCGTSLKEFLRSEGVAYSTYNYWSKKTKAESETLPIAPISIREESRQEQLPMPMVGVELPGVTLAFPNGVRAHFGRGSEGVLMQVLSQSMSWAMFCLNDTMRYHLCPGRTDMRKGINSLIGVVKEQMGADVRNGDVFIFIGASRKLMKLLHAEDGGMVMYVKRLEAGRFKLPEYDAQTKSYPMEWRDLVVMVEGLTEDPSARLRRLRAERTEYHV